MPGTWHVRILQWTKPTGSQSWWKSQPHFLYTPASSPPPWPHQTVPILHIPQTLTCSHPLVLCAPTRQFFSEDVNSLLCWNLILALPSQELGRNNLLKKIMYVVNVFCIWNTVFSEDSNVFLLIDVSTSRIKTFPQPLSYFLILQASLLLQDFF